jgi:hypothetical protein
MSFTFDIEGIDTIQERLAAASEVVFKEVDAEIGASVKVMEQGAKRDAPVDQGLLRNEISSQQERPLVWSLISQASYSAFIEFGTRSQVQIPPGLEAEAAAARGSTGGTLGAKQAIFQWCARHGIEQKFWYAIFVKIMVRGIRPHPFFFKQLDAEKANLLNRLQQIL